MDIPQPEIFDNYNHRMGSVDLSDHSVIRLQRVAFTYMFDLAVVNAWNISLILPHQKTSQIDLVKYIALYNLVKSCSSNRKCKRDTVPYL